MTKWWSAAGAGTGQIYTSVFFGAKPGLIGWHRKSFTYEGDM